MMVLDADESQLLAKAEAACQRMAPLWPLKNFVASNPYLGLTSQSFWKVHETLERITGTGLCMPRAYYIDQIQQNRITHDDLAAALIEFGGLSDVTSFERDLAQDSPSLSTPFPLVTDILGALDSQDWSGFVVERISRYCAAYFDEGQALLPLPWKNISLYKGWLQFTYFDKSPRMLGIRGMRKAIAEWPDTAKEAIVLALRELNVPPEAVDDYLYAALLSIGGWAGWTRYLRWQAELQGHENDAILELLAIRLAWDALFYQLRYSESLKTRWHESMAASVNHADTGISINAVLQTAFEIGYQRRLAMFLNGPSDTKKDAARPTAQAVFCIDVRSEVYRRALESITSGVKTIGFPGFFGIPMEYLRLGDREAKAHLPVFLKPTYRVQEGVACEKDEHKKGKLILHRQVSMGIAKAWKSFKTSASSAFAFVEALGLLWVPKLISDSMGWTRPVPDPESLGLSFTMRRQLRPVLKPTVDREFSGIPETDRPILAASMLRNMGLVKNFARLVLFIGHGSTTVNNPHATSLDCGACGGQSGEASARTAVALLNDPLTRRGLVHHGIEIPEDTYFIAGLHDTTTDEIHLLNMGDIPQSHTTDMVPLCQWLTAASQMARTERATDLGIGQMPTDLILRDLRRRTRDWSEIRPEWALAGNAAFIAAPRARTARRNLEGRVFLHDYDWHTDENFSTLQLIMTAPMIVAHWINMQYYGSMVDNRRFGSGNKVLHNVVGGSIGVLEGNGGDLRVGLAMQSLTNGKRWIHEPMRLNVIIEAPKTAIDDVVARHEQVRQLVDNSWIHLFQIDESGHLNRRHRHQQWRQ